MGITKIISIKEQLGARLDYVTNSEKTHLATDITYVTNPEKTEQSFFVSAINCLTAASAFDEMMNTKIRFGKTDGVQGFHIIQSFAPGEVTPEQAHNIGQEFCKRLLGDRFEAVIGTHLDKAHLHNHIIINSVSHIDGKKYHSSYQHYYREIRKISDELCAEHHLKVIEPKGKGNHYAVWKAEKAGNPTLSQMLRDEIDLVIRDCFDFPDFLNLLEKKGYAVSRNPNRKYLTVRPPGAKRNFRLDRLGAGYTVEDIRRRIQEQQRAILEGRVSAYQPLPVRRYRFSGSWKTVRKKKITGFYALYLRYVYLLRRYKKPTRKKSLMKCVVRCSVWNAIRRNFYISTNTVFPPWRSLSNGKRKLSRRSSSGQNSGNHSIRKGGMNPMRKSRKCSPVRLTARPPPCRNFGKSKSSVSRLQIRFPAFSRTYGSLS